MGGDRLRQIIEKGAPVVGAWVTILISDGTI